MLKKLIHSVLILIVGAILGYVLLMASFLIKVPSETYEEIDAILSAEGYHPRESVRTGKTDYFHEPVPDILDFATDQLIIKYSLQNPDEPIYKHAAIEDYCRYWHGYIIFWRPFFRLFDLDEGRIVNLGIQLFLAILLAYKLLLVSKRKTYAFAWLTVYYFMSPNSMACNLQLSSIYYVTVLVALATLYFRKYFCNKGRYVYLFLLSGMCTSYFDFLTYPMLTWAIPAALMIAFYEYEGDTLNDRWTKFANAIRTIVSAIFWIVGYLVFWVEKWVIGQIVTGKDVIRSEALVETSLRVGIKDSMSLGERINSFWVNWRHLTYLPFALIFAVWMIYWIVKMVRRGFVKDSKVIAYTIMMFSAPVWYFCGAEHTTGHHYYTWRVCLGSLFAILMLVCLNSEVEIKVKNAKALIQRALIIVGCFLLSTIVYWITPVEKQQFWNYDLACEERMLPAGESAAYVMQYTPRYALTTSLGSVFESESTSGYYEYLLYDGDQLLYREAVSTEDFHESRLHQIPVKWHLKKGKAYTLVLSTEHLDKPSTIWVEKQADRYEYVGNEEAMQIGFTYHTPFTDKSNTMLYVLTWVALGMAIVMTGYAVIGKEKCI